MIKFKKASGLVRLFMDAMEFYYMAMPNDTIYYLYSRPVGRMYRHELKHIEQYNRDGVIKYLIRWWWQYITVGYDNIDYEIEAREAETSLI